jgi:hypothetical protein
MRALFPVVLAALAASPCAHAAQTLQLQGTLSGKDHQRYLELPFTVPDGTARVDVTLRHDGAG